MCQEFNRDRRRFLSMAGVTIGGARFGAIGAERVQSASTKTFGELKQVNAGILNVGYAEVGPAVGPAVVLLHGWPYDIHSFIDVAPLLATRGFRVLVPYCVARVQRASFQPKLPAMGSRRHSRPTKLRSWIHPGKRD